MSETTPESGPNANVSEPEATAERAVAAEPSVAEPTSSEPEAAAAQDAQAEPAAVPATEAPAAPAPAPAPAPASAGAEPQDDENDVANPPSEPVSARGHVNRPAKTIEPEPVVASHDDVAAAVARSTDEPGASAGGSATVDTASPVQSATPVIVAAEAAKLQQDAEARQSGAATAPERTQAQPTAAQPTADQRPADQQPAAVPAGAYAAGAASPIFIQRPTPPKRKSNRGFGILLALVGTVVFAALWVLAVVVVGYLLTPNGEFADALTRFFLGQIAGWVPVVAFFIGMVVLIQVLNRARWWAYILGGLFVALFVYFAYVGASLVDLHVWTLNGNEASVVLQRLWVAPFAVLAGVIAREISVWTGAWLAARGRKLKARNAEAQADYEQQLADAQNQAVAAYAQPQGY